MKKPLIFISAIVQILLLSNICLAQKEVEKPIEIKNIGDIKVDSLVDNPNFIVCNNYIYQYFNDSNGLEIEGEKTKIEDFYKRNFKSKYLPNQSGLIRVRFVVNCKGETDRFRLIAMDENYNEKLFDATITTQLLKLTKQLKGWKVKLLQGYMIDYYQYLIFKMKDGQIIEILP